jgi:hypothetical protein
VDIEQAGREFERLIYSRMGVTKDDDELSALARQ